MAAPEIDFLAGAFYVDGARDAYRWLRDEAPVFFDERSGLWGVSRYDDVVAVSKDAATFSNEGGSRPDTGALPWMIDLDGADHSKRRTIVSAGFTSKNIRLLEPKLVGLTDDLIDNVCERGECDFVADIAALLPLMVIAEMVGIPPEDRMLLLDVTHRLLKSLDGDPAGYAAAAEAFGTWTEYAHAMTKRRRAEPEDDLWTTLAHAEGLTDNDIAMEALLLFIGGDETTRQVASGGLEQLLLRELRPSDIPTAVEEMLRWVSPIKNMARTATVDTEIAGTLIPQGTKLIVLYESANFDERHFEGPDTFDPNRAPNDHVAFGSGRHHCLGASLARAELIVLFDRVLTRMPAIRLAADDLPRSIAGIGSMPISFTPTRRLGP